MKLSNLKLPNLKQHFNKNTPKQVQAQRSMPHSHVKKRKIRYDRILLVVLLIVLLIVLIVSCATRGGKDESSGGTTATGAKTATSEKQGGSLGSFIDANSGDGSSLFNETASTVSVNADQMNAGDLILVNDQHAYTFAADDISVVSIYENRNESYKTSDMEVSLDADVISRLNELMAAFSQATGHSDLRVIGGYRTKEDQDKRHQSDPDDKDIPTGGCSDYNTGRSFSLQMPTDGGTNYYSATGDYAWFAENAANYGFVLRFPAEKESYTNRTSRTHIFRYVGVPHAVYMTQNNLCLEEYIEAIKAYTPDTEPLTVTVGDTRYSVFYVQANTEGSTEIAIPACSTYSISGNNADGFIVTCENTASEAE